MKKYLAVFLSMILIFSTVISTTVSVAAAGDSLATATTVTLGKKYSGQITESNSKDVYKFTLNASGTININLKAYIYCTHYYLYDENGNNIWESRWQYWNETSEMYTLNRSIDLTKGVYYFAVERCEGTGSYNFVVSYSNANESFVEIQGGNNNAIKYADGISFSKAYKGQIAINDDKDIYKFTVSASGRIKINLEACIYCTHYYLYDENGNNIWEAKWQYWNETSELYTLSENIDLTKGVYYFAVERCDGTGNYSFSISYKSAGESFAETGFGNNQSIKDADSISINKTYKGQIAKNDDKDIYKFSLTKAGKVEIKLTAYIYCTHYYLYDKDGNVVWEARWQYWNNTSEKYTLNQALDLTKGTYYFAIEKCDGTGNYSFSIDFGKCATPVLSAITNTASGVKVTWGKVSGADSYIVYKKTYNATTKTWSGWSKVASVTSTSYLDKSVKSGTYYRYTVKATNEVGASGYDTSGLKTYFLSTPKATTANSNSGVVVKWNKIAGANGYIVYRKTGNGSWQKLATVKGASKVSYTDTKAKSGVTYRYTVKAYYSSYVSAYNTNGYAVRRLTTPSLKSVSSAKSGVTFTWNKVTGATGYNVYRKTGTGGWQKIATVKGSSCLDKTAKKGVTYKYTVRAYYGTSTSYYNTKGLTIKDKY